MNIFDLVNNINNKMNDFFTALRNHDHPDLSLVNHTHTELVDLTDEINWIEEHADLRTTASIGLEVGEDSGTYWINFSWFKCMHWVMDNNINIDWYVNNNDVNYYELSLFIKQDDTVPYAITFGSDFIQFVNDTTMLNDFNTTTGGIYLFKFYREPMDDKIYYHIEQLT